MVGRLTSASRRELLREMQTIMVACAGRTAGRFRTATRTVVCSLMVVCVARIRARSSTAMPVVQTVTTTEPNSTTVYDNGEEEDDNEPTGLALSSSQADNYSTGDAIDEDEKEKIEEQVYEENKVWAITILVINCIYTLLLLIILGAILLGKEKFINRFHLNESNNYNWIFYIIIMIIPFIIFTSLYLSFGFGDSDVATTNKIMIPINYILIIFLMIWTGVSHKFYFTQKSNNNLTTNTQTNKQLPPAINPKPLTAENIAKGLLKKGGKRKIRNRK